MKGWAIINISSRYNDKSVFYLDFSVRITILLSLANVFLFVGGDLVRTIRDEIQDYRIRRNWRR